MATVVTIRNRAGVHFVTFVVVEYVNVFTRKEYKDFVCCAVVVSCSESEKSGQPGVFITLTTAGACREVAGHPWSLLFIILNYFV